MSSAVALKSDPAPILACTISRDMLNFDLLIEDMESELGEAWGDLSFDDASVFLTQPEAADLQFVAIAVDRHDEADIGRVADIITTAKTRGVKVILIADTVSPTTLHQLLRLGAQDFVPYPLPEGALHDAIERICRSAPAPENAPDNSPDKTEVKPATRIGTRSAIFAIQGLAGGCGATTLAVNLAWELANIDKKKAPSVCLIDFDLQQGAVSTFLDLPRRDVIFEMLQDVSGMDVDGFKQALVSYDDKLSVFTAPADMLPLDIITSQDVNGLLDLATQCFDIVVVDMPKTTVQWTETVLVRSDVYFAPLELDMRSAQNAIRFIRALQSEELPLDKVNFVLNRAPGMTDLGGKGRVKLLSESLGVKIATMLPDGKRQVKQCCDHGVPLSAMAQKNPLRKEILKLATGLHDAMLREAAEG